MACSTELGATAPGAVLLSSPPPSGLLPTALKIARRHPLVFARVNATFSLLPGAARDNMLSASQIVATAQAYDAQHEIIVDVAHDSMLELRWRAVADRILAWLRENHDASA